MTPPEPAGSSPITVVGAGGIGGIIAARLSVRGHAVRVVEASSAHFDAMRREGLRLDTPTGTLHTRPFEVLEPSEVDQPLDVTVLAVKSRHTDVALETIAPHLRSTGVVISLQNGLNADRIARAVGRQRTLGGMVHLVGAYIGPGHVQQFDEGHLFIGDLNGGRSRHADAAASLLSDAVPTEAVPSIDGYIWAKLVHTCYLVGTALVDTPSSEMLKPQWARRIFVAIMKEAAEVARCEGVELQPYAGFDARTMQFEDEQGLQAALAMLPTGSAKGNSGIWRDIKIRKQPTETPYITGEVVRRGRSHGLAMALNERVAALVAAIETGEQEMSWDHLRSLQPLAEAVLQGKLVPHRPARSEAGLG